MATHDYVIANGTGAAVRSDLNDALAAIVSNNSSATEPTTTYAYMWWADTTAGQLKRRNAANDGWIVVQELDGTLLMEDGTVSLPGLAFGSDLNTGFFRPGADQLAIATNGVERVEFGTSEVVFNDGGADVDFRIEGDTNANLFFVDASTDRIGLGTSSVNANLHVSNTAGEAEVRITAKSTNQGILRFGNEVDQTLASIRFDSTDDSFRFYGSNDTERLRIDSSGRCGIGTTSPSQLLHLRSSTAADTYTRYENSLTDTYVGTKADGSLNFYQSGAYPLTLATNGTERARIDSSGRLLVGTSSTSNNIRFLVQGSPSYSGGVVQIANSGSTPANGDDLGAIQFSDSNHTTSARILVQRDGGTWTSNTSMPTRLVFSTTADGASSPTERMRITNGGNILLGSDNSSVGAEEGIKFVNVNSSTPYMGIVANTAGAGDTFYHYYNLNATYNGYRFQVRNDGGIANFSANNVNLCDEREKKNIENLDSTWDCLKHWELKKFNYNEDADTEAPRYGVIAQQVEPHCPEVITEWKKGKNDNGDDIIRMGVKEQQMYWMAIKALQEAQVRIEALEAEVAALKAQ